MKKKLHLMLSKLVIWLLKSNTLSGDDKVKVTNALLKNIGALPLRSTISFDNNQTLHINGKKLDMEHATIFVDSCRSLKESFARQVIREQVKFLAIEIGVHQALNSEQVMFSKAALWVIQEEDKIINSIVD